MKIRVLKLRFLAFPRGPGGFRKLREACRKRFHLSWYSTCKCPWSRVVATEPPGGICFCRVRCMGTLQGYSRLRALPPYWISNIVMIVLAAITAASGVRGLGCSNVFLGFPLVFLQLAFSKYSPNNPYLQ